MTSQSESSQAKKRERSNSPGKSTSTKLFITNLDGEGDLKTIEADLRKMFEKFGDLENLVAKRNRNSEYCFAFAEFKSIESAKQCVESFDGASIGGKKIKVEFQDDNKRRKDSNKGCYNCGKMGHFARECHNSRNDSPRRGQKRRRSRSRSDSYRDRKRKHKKRHRSYSSQSSRSHHKIKKQKRRRSRDRDEKKKKKHKRSYSSD